MRKVLFAASFLLAPGVAVAEVDVMLGGYVSLTWSDNDASPVFNTLNTTGGALTLGGVGAADAAVGTSRSLDAEIRTSASVDVAGLNWMGQIDLGMSSNDTKVEFKRGMIGVSSDFGELFYREGGPRADYFSYADDLSAGGSGVSSKLFDHEFASSFGGDEVGYHLNYGDLDVEATYDLDHKAIAGQVRYNVGLSGYDFTVAAHGISNPIDGGMLSTYADDYYGVAVYGGIDFGDIEIGLSIGQDELANWMKQSAGNETDVMRRFGSIGVSYTAIDALKLSVDMDRAVTSAEWGCTGVEIECAAGATTPTVPAYFDAGIGGGFATSGEIGTAFSVGAEYQATKSVSVGGWFARYSNRSTLALDSTAALGLVRGFKEMDGQSIGFRAKISF